MLYISRSTPFSRIDFVISLTFTLRGILDARIRCEAVDISRTCDELDLSSSTWRDLFLVDIIRNACLVNSRWS